MTFESLKEGLHASHCVIPHVLRTKGLIIRHECSNEPLRLTNSHLVYTKSGRLEARHLMPGNTVFGDLDQRKLCRVLSVSSEDSEQTYFGLNCLRSDVVTNGVKTSVFGNYHAFPALYMKAMGSLFGVGNASNVGLKMLMVLENLKLIDLNA